MLQSNKQQYYGLEAHLPSSLALKLPVAIAAGSALLFALAVQNSGAVTLATVAPTSRAQTVAGQIADLRVPAGLPSNLDQRVAAVRVQAAKSGVSAPDKVNSTAALFAPVVGTIGAIIALFAWNQRSQKAVHNDEAMFAASGEKLSQWYGATRNLYLGSLSEGAPAHLKGEMPGDAGFDILELATQPKRLERYRQAEIINGRWAMLGIVGCIAPELLQKYNGVSYGDAGVWFKAGAQVFSSEGINYLGNPSLIHAKSITAILVTELLLVGLVEAFRVSGGPLGPATDPVYPGKAFDPLGLSKDADTFALLKVNEVKNGRLAMTAMLGLFMQGFATGKGPIENLATHLANPAGENIITFHQKVLSEYTGVAML